MAQEITTQFALSYTKGSAYQNIPSRTVYIDSLTNTKVGGTQIVGTTHELLILNDVASCGAGYFNNTDSTNYIELGVVVAATFYPLITIPAGQWAFVPRLATTSIYAKANTAAVNLDYVIFSQ